MKVSFVHPDLGIGGAERLVVDAAVALKKRGHDITIFTSYYDPNRAFPEIKQENIPVVTRGAFIPRHVRGKGLVVFAILKSWFLGCCLLYNSCLGDAPDVFIVDQISASIPILKLTRRNILFYCHFPDKLLSKRESLLKKLYRLPIDILEEFTTKMADVVVVNSKFTASVFSRAFPFIPLVPSVLYPGIALASYDLPVDMKNESVSSLANFTKNRKIILSINRFERKKNIELAIESISLLRTDWPKEFSSIALVIAGGYDARVKENVEYLKELSVLATSLSLSHHVWKVNESIPSDAQILFLPSFSSEQRTFLLLHSICLCYTPSEEHFGIVPLESMYSKLPVVACNNGGPKETIINDKTGYLCDSTAQEFSRAIQTLVQDPSKKVIFGKAGRDHVANSFSIDRFGDRLEEIVIYTRSTFNLDATVTFYTSIILCSSLLLLLALVV